MFITIGVAARARADSLWTEASVRDAYTPVEELSYEIIVDSRNGYDARVRLRVAIHNSSIRPQDFVLTLGAPRHTELRALSVARDGHWSHGQAIDGGTGTPVDVRPAGTVFARRVAPGDRDGLPAVEVVGYGLDAGSTLQAELEFAAYPVMLGGRWQIDLPRRELRTANMATQRRVLVDGLPEETAFYVDSASSRGAPYMISRVENTVTVAWPDQLRRAGQLDGHFLVFEDRFLVYLRLGRSRRLRPDHIIFVVDRSRSMSPRFRRDTAQVFRALAEVLPERTTFSAITFARDAKSLLNASSVALPRLRHQAARDEVVRKLDVVGRTQGTNLPAALELAHAQLKRSRATHPLVVVITDGRLPTSRSVAPWRARFAQRRAEILFVIDDPILAQYGIEATHPMVDVAAELGARVSVNRLASFGDSDAEALLSAPRVLGDLSLSFGRGASVGQNLPRGLVAGSFVRLEGTYAGVAPRSVTIRGRDGSRSVRKRVRAHRMPPVPSALVASTEDLVLAADDSFVRPRWYKASLRRESLAAVAQAGRGGLEVRGRLDQDIIRRYLRAHVRPRASACYNQALGRQPDQQGRIEYDIEMGKGEVMWAQIAQHGLRHDDAPLLACLTEAAWSLEVPAGKLDAATYRVRYPLGLVAPVGPRRGELTTDDKILIDSLLERAANLAQ